MKKRFSVSKILCWAGGPSMLKAPHILSTFGFNRLALALPISLVSNLDEEDCKNITGDPGRHAP